MKRLALLFVLLGTLALRADPGNWLQNGDFADGTIDHWRDGGRAPSDFTPENPLDKPDPFTSKGLIVPLRHVQWTHIAQDFRSKSTAGVLRITYMVSPDLAFSDKPEDYVDVPHQIDYSGWKPFNTPPGEWIVFVADFGQAVPHGVYYEINPKLGSSTPQTYQAHIEGLTSLEDKTITLAFPPGTGTLVILNISLSDQ